MPINQRDCYIEIGTSVLVDNTLANSLCLPAPTTLPSQNEFLAEAGRNALGTMVIQRVGRTQYKTEISWAKIDSEIWWDINRWFDSNGYVFYMKFFDHAVGKVKIQRFYRGNIKAAEPSSTQKTINGYSVPAYYKNAGFSIIDMGEKYVKVLAVM